MDIQNLPNNLEAEQAVLSAILLNNRALEYTNEFLKPEHFIHPAHQEIYKLAEKYFAKGIPFDKTTTQEYLNQTGVLESLGGADYISKLMSGGAGIGDIRSYGRIVYDNFLRREIIHLGQQMIQSATAVDPDKTAENHIEAAESKLFEMAMSDSAADAVPISDAFRETMREIEVAARQTNGLSGLTTGLRDLDAVIHGMHKSDLIIIAGRPGMGKSTAALNMAFNAAYALKNKTANSEFKGAVVFFSLEMSKSQLAAKVLSSQTDIPSNVMREGKTSDLDMKKLSDAAAFLNDLPLVLDETPAMSVASIRAKARRIARKYKGIALIVIDYLQLMQSSGGGRRDANRVQEISEITRGLKMLAKELSVPVLALSQLSRSVESVDRPNKKPMLSDLRDSGSIEQDADSVIFVYREEYYLTNKDPEDNLNYIGKTPRLSPEAFKERLAASKNKAEFVIAKNRHGPTREVKLNCLLQYSRFFDCDDDLAIAPSDMDMPPPSSSQHDVPSPDEIPDF